MNFIEHKPNAIFSIPKFQNLFSFGFLPLFRVWRRNRFEHRPKEILPQRSVSQPTGRRKKPTLINIDRRHIANIHFTSANRHAAEIRAESRRARRPQTHQDTRRG